MGDAHPVLNEEWRDIGSGFGQLLPGCPALDGTLNFSVSWFGWL
jgi:hypothetical protein